MTGTAAVAQPSTHRLVVLMVALSGMSYFNRTILAIAAPGIMQEFAISPTAMGTVYSAALLSYTILMTPGGRLADRYGPRLVLGLGTLGTAVFTGLTALCGTPGLGSLIGVLPALVLIRMLFGVFGAPLYPSCGRTTASLIPAPRRASAQAWIISGAAIGAAIAPLLFTRSIAAFGWRLAFAGAALATAVLAGWWYALLKGSRVPAQARQAPAGGGWKALIGNRDLLLLTISYALLNYFEYIFFYWMFYYLREVRHLGEDQTTASTTVLFLTMAIFTPTGGIVADRLAARMGHFRARRLVSVTGMAASACLLCAGARSDNDIAVVALLSLALGCACAAEGPFWATILQTSGANAGAAGGILNTGGNLGGMLAPVLTPAIAARYGWAAGLYFGALLVLGGVLCWYFLSADDAAETVSPELAANEGI